MIRKIIQIDEEKCNGCGACAQACHEGAIGMVNGKAKLLRDDYCDGLGDCLPTCPTGAISFVEREAAGAIHAPMFRESLSPKSMIFPVVIPVILAFPPFVPNTQAPLPVTVQVADRGRWFPYPRGKRNSFSALPK